MLVSQLWRYPVKSMIGEQVDTVDLDATGVVGDRAWAARDLERGGIRGAKKIGALMRLGARAIDSNHAEIAMPNGTTTTTMAADVDQLVSAAVGHRVQLEQLRPASDVEHFRRGDPDSDDFMIELRDIFGRDDDEPLPDMTIFPPELVEFESPPGSYYDAFPLMVMTESALRSITDALPDSQVDVRRFRPSIVIDDETLGGHPEFEWPGRRARIGSAEIEFGALCPRCVMVTREIDAALPADRAVLRHIIRELDQNLGIYATVTTPGAVATGDHFALI